MNFSSDSDFSDGSTGLSRNFHCSTPKKVLRRQTRHLSEVRILSPRMPESSGYVSPAIYSSREFLDKRSIMNNALGCLFIYVCVLGRYLSKKQRTRTRIHSWLRT